ncbi:NAD(P)-binding domain-containing protein [Paenibacillus sp. Y412MC10]|uniref:NAD(P)-binding domain-containing protein n=1 Tax=Geobacillus sp. (strain Y412MC10) TaxID=481743 RepID=UPI0028CB4408|nr:NAD(P)-binding domain-containing protein [Paenibacillus sp. Y412MC10]
MSVIGLGMMGSALAQAFLMEGSRTTVWNRTPDKAETLAAQGAVAAGTVAEAIAASPLIVICVLMMWPYRRSPGQGVRHVQGSSFHAEI